jgi:hypothetical protein
MRKLILLLLPFFLLTSCRTTTEPDDNQNAPKVGSTFSYDYDVRGQDNNVIESGSIVTELVKTNHSFAGKSNVLVFVDNEMDTTYFAKESNGNISAYIDTDASGNLGMTQPFWINFPISGSGGEDRVIAQQQIDYNGAPATLRAVLTSEFDGTQSTSVSGKPVTVKRAVTTIRLEVIVVGLVVETVEILNGSLSWMPELNACYATEQAIQLEERMVYSQEITSMNIK